MNSAGTACWNGCAVNQLPKVGERTAVLEATPGQPNNVTYTSNLLLNLARQVITAKLNLARGSTASAEVQTAIASASSAIGVSLTNGQIRLTTALSTESASALNSTIENFNSAADCG